MCETLSHEGQKVRCQSTSQEDYVLGFVFVPLWLFGESASAGAERRGLNSLPASNSVLIRAGWLEASALASTAEAAMGDEEASGSHEKSTA